MHPPSSPLAKHKSSNHPHQPQPFSNPFSPFILSDSHKYVRNPPGVMLILKMKKLSQDAKTMPDDLSAARGQADQVS